MKNSKEDISKIRKEVRNILKESMGVSQKDRLVSILNSLEFKDDILAVGGEIYAVGGIVRDAIMNTPSDDLDIVVRGVEYNTLFKILSKYGSAKDTSHVDEDGKKDFGSTIFVSNNDKFNEYLASNGVVSDIDVMLPRRDAKDPNVKGHKGIKSDVNPMYTIHDDLERRDITINAIAIGLDGELISVGSGLDDIKNGVIKAVNSDAFMEDPLRMLRAVRFAARYNYDWDEATLALIRDNNVLLSDKEELPRERFLKEFEKMIGKADLARAVKLIVELGMYKSIFGVESKIQDFSKFDKADSVAEFSYMLFDNEPIKNRLALIVNNITNSTSDIAYVEALNHYLSKVKGKNLDFVKEINEMAEVYKKSNRAALESSYVEPEHKEIANKFSSGQLPKGEHDVAFKGVEFRDFAIELITDEFGEFNNRDYGKKLGDAKKLAVQAIYSGELENSEEVIKNFLINTKEQWMF